MGNQYDIFSPEIIGIVTLALAALVLTLIAGAIIYMLFKGNLKDRLANFLFEAGPDGKGGKASVSRLQMII